MLFSVLAAVAGGSVGAGRIARWASGSSKVLPPLRSLGVGGVLGGLVGTWWARRRS